MHWILYSILLSMCNIKLLYYVDFTFFVSIEHIICQTTWFDWCPCMCAEWNCSMCRLYFHWYLPILSSSLLWSNKNTMFLGGFHSSCSVASISYCSSMLSGKSFSINVMNCCNVTFFYLTILCLNCLKYTSGTHLRINFFMYSTSWLNK